jgi:class 3 adenylate cyclase
MMASQITLVRYIFIDIVGFTLGRSVEAQVRIMKILNRSVRQSVAALEIDGSKLIYLPTGDGVCICLIDQSAPLDFDIKIAIMMLETVHALWLAETEEECRFAIRVGLNENHDNIVLDIGGQRRNFVGMGVNHAQRLMSLAAPFQLLMGPSVYQRLSQRRTYRPHLYPLHGIVKHGEKVLCYGYHDPGLACFASAASRRSRPSQQEPSDARSGPKAPVQLPLRTPNPADRSSKPRNSFKI